MQSTFTCQRCLISLRKSLDRTSSLTSYGTPSRRWNCTAVNQDARRTWQIQSPMKQPQRRSAASLGALEKDSSNDPNSKALILRPTPPSPKFNKPSSRHPTEVLIQPDDLFHSMSNSPVPEMRRRAAFIKAHAYCAHPSHQQVGVPIAAPKPEVAEANSAPMLPPAHVRFECPDCGTPVYCSEEHWADDYENHMKICDTLREINEDDHDLRSGREFDEFEYPDLPLPQALVNMTNWDTYLYTREYKALNELRSLRAVTRLMTYPMTIASILHELSPYNVKRGGRLTVEGLRSFSALRWTLHPPKTGAGPTMKGIRPVPPPVRVFVLGARSESSLPRNVWCQLSWLFLRHSFHVIFIGPESMATRDDPLPEPTERNPWGKIIDERFDYKMKISTYVQYYHTLHKAGEFAPYDPYFDCFVMFHPGLGHPASSHEWEETVPLLFETKVPIIITGYTEWDMNRDWKWMCERFGGEFDLLMEPGENKFRSLRWMLNDWDPRDITCANWGVWAFRGKRLDAMKKEGPFRRLINLLTT